MVIEHLKSELKRHNLELIVKVDGREGVDFLVGDSELYFQSIIADAGQRSIKISKQELGSPKVNLFVVLVLILDDKPRAFYLIPSTDLAQSNSEFFIENDVSLMPSLSNWEIKVTSNTVPALVKYSLDNMIDKLKA
jgi:hypothetical protein